MRSMGLDDLVESPPEMTKDAQKALDCWNFLGGWFPERLAIYDALYGVGDWDLMIDLLLSIRNEAR